DVPSGGSGSHRLRIRGLPEPIRQPCTRAGNQAVTEEPLSLCRVRLHDLQRLSLDAVEVHVVRAGVDVLQDPATLPLVTERQRLTVRLTKHQIRVAPELEDIL